MDRMVVSLQMVNADAVRHHHALEICQYVVIQELHMPFAPATQEVMGSHLHVLNPTQHAQQTGFVL